ncbi:MAG: conjugal transfer protein [Solirubrobacterales bacterium]
MNASTVRVPARGRTSLRSLLRGVGRAAIWTVLALLLLRGALAGSASQVTARPTAAASPADQQSQAFAIRFARTYLSDPSPSALSPFLAEGARVGTGRSAGGGEAVAQAEVTESEPLGNRRAVLTVACELRDARTLYLAVPIVRSQAGEVAALGAPSIVAAPGLPGADPERPRALTGADAGAIQALVEKFLPAYVEGSEPSDLAYFVAPGSAVQPLGGGLDLASVSGVTQLGSSEGPRREVLAAARLTDPASGAGYPVVYRLELVKGARWYVRAVRGAVS